jgi:hypothetical protein
MKGSIPELIGGTTSGRNQAVRRACALGAIMLAAMTSAAETARADEGGVSFWLPGLYGSLAAVPGHPGFGLASIFYHTSVSADVSRTFFRGGRFVAGLDADADLLLVVPSYTFAQPVLGGQLTLSMMSVFGNNRVGIDATLTGPLGNTISGRFSDSVTGFGDLYPAATLKWNHGVHNFMTYVTGDIPVGDYNSNRLANLGIGHGAIDGGLGYTYLDPTKGHEFSVVAGLTYNFINPDTQYRNGLDLHVDWGASQFLSKQLLVGLVGYAYQQLRRWCASRSKAPFGLWTDRAEGSTRNVTSEPFLRFSAAAGRTARALAAFVTLGTLDATSPASAQGACAQGAWCAHYSGRAGGTNCGFYTLQQCREAISGVGGVCSPSPTSAKILHRGGRRAATSEGLAAAGSPAERHRSHRLGDFPMSGSGFARGLFQGFT